MRLLYVGSKTGTSLQRAEAARRLGHQVIHITPEETLPKHWKLWLNRQGGFGIDHLVSRALKQRINGRVFDHVHVDSGEAIGPKSMTQLRKAAPTISHYTGDNPYATPTPERKRWTLFLQVLDQYDLTVTVERDGQENKMRAKGARNPCAVPHCADEIVHRPFDAPLAPRWQSEVAFVGTWMPGRDIFMQTLAEAGLDLAIYGPRWHKATNLAMLKPYIRSSYLEGRDYAAAIAGARIALVILNANNSDTHTNRSIEIPAIGTAMCAIRTQTHTSLYQEGREALFFDSADDCALQCKTLLAAPDKLTNLARAGQSRAAENGNFNEALMGKILAQATGAQT